MHGVKSLVGLRRIWVATAAFAVSACALLGLSYSSFASPPSACSNEAIRAAQGTTRLPECRAYETVTPHYKQAFPLYPKSIAADGEKALLFGLANLGAFGAGESAIEGELYLASRGTGGWQLAPLDAPLSEFVGQIPISYEATSGETLWEQHSPSQSSFTRDLYARSVGGEYRLIGQVSVPFAGEETQEADYMFTFTEHSDVPFAATHDYGHVIVRAIAAEDYLPFDGTVSGSSFYEYSGTDNPPALIGVEGEKGSHHLISLCGTNLGSTQTIAGLGSAFNALSADGETVFFTAEPENECGARGPKVAEVFARLHGSALSPSPAETVDVSTDECTEACGGESSKNFEGASENGKIVFFTSTQKLTNNAVDGTASGEAYTGSGCAGTEEGAGGCNLYTYNFNDPSVACRESHRCLKLVASREVLGVAGIAEDGQRIYYVKRNAEGAPDLYAYDMVSERSTLVAHLSNGDSEIWKKEFRKPVEVAGEDGRFLLFASATPGLTSDQTGGAVQLFEYDAVSGELVRVTKGEDGYNEDGNGVEAGVSRNSIEEVTEKLGRPFDYKTETNRFNVSRDGRTVIFRTTGKLSPFALSAGRCSSVYEFHTEGTLSAGEVHLLSDGEDTHQIGPLCGALVYPAMMDANAENAFFSSGDSLVAGDVDGGQRNLFDARVGGGFAPSLGAGCFGEGCASPVPSSAPRLGPEGSAVQGPEAGGVKSVVSSGGVSSESGGGKAKAKAKKKAKPRHSRGASKRALKACGSKPRGRRIACERAARRKGVAR